MMRQLVGNFWFRGGDVSMSLMLMPVIGGVVEGYAFVDVPHAVMSVVSCLAASSETVCM